MYVSVLSLLTKKVPPYIISSRKTSAFQTFRIFFFYPEDKSSPNMHSLIAIYLFECEDALFNFFYFLSKRESDFLLFPSYFSSQFFMILYSSWYFILSSSMEKAFMPWDFKVIPMLYKQKYFPMLKKTPFLMGEKRLKTTSIAKRIRILLGFLIHSSNKVLIS